MVRRSFLSVESPSKERAQEKASLSSASAQSSSSCIGTVDVRFQAEGVSLFAPSLSTLLADRSRPDILECLLFACKEAYCGLDIYSHLESASEGADSAPAVTDPVRFLSAASNVLSFPISSAGQIGAPFQAEVLMPTFAKVGTLLELRVSVSSGVSRVERLHVHAAANDRYLLFGRSSLVLEVPAYSSATFSLFVVPLASGKHYLPSLVVTWDPAGASLPTSTFLSVKGTFLSCSVLCGFFLLLKTDNIHPPFL